MLRTESRCAAILVSGLAVASACADVPYEVILYEGDPVPGGLPGELIDRVFTPVIDNTGDVYLVAWWNTGTSDDGILRHTNGVLSLFLEEDVPAPGLTYGTGSLWNNSMMVSPGGFATGIAIGTGVTPGDAVLFFDDQGISEIHIDGMPSPLGDGEVYVRHNPVGMMSDGRLVISALFGNTTGGENDDRALLRYDTSDMTWDGLVREGEPLPGAPTGVFEGTCESSLRTFCTPDSNDSGEAAFNASEGIFVSNGSSVRAVARIGEPAPGAEEFLSMSAARINSAGTVAFSANVQGNSSFDAVYIEIGGVLGFAPLGGGAPTTAGGVLGTFRTPVSTSVQLNDQNQVLFVSDTLEPDPGPSTNRIGEGLFVAENGGLRSIARRYEPAPSGGTYASLTGGSYWVINSHGTILYTARIDPGNGDLTEAAFLYTPGVGSDRIIAVGDAVGSRVVSDIVAVETTATSANALNDAGEFTFQIDFTDGTGAIVRSPSPPPCPADLTADGVLNVDDIELFVTAFLSADLAADCDANTVLNVDDIECFVAAFLAGCG